MIHTSNPIRTNLGCGQLLPFLADGQLEDRPALLLQDASLALEATLLLAQLAPQGLLKSRLYRGEQGWARALDLYLSSYTHHIT